MHKNRWVIFPRPKKNPLVRMFCFSYAGGGTSFFVSWDNLLPETIELAPIRLPGRESRLAEQPFTAMDTIIPPLMDAIVPYLDEYPFVFFGHSLGSFIAFELIQTLMAKNLPLPQNLFVSAARAPHLVDESKQLHLLPEAEFINELRQLNGTPEALLQNKEMLALILPCLKADFTVSETYRLANSTQKLPFPITAFYGKQDPKATYTQVTAWENHTDRQFNIHQLPGDHFFLHEHKDKLLSFLLHELTPMITHV